LEKTVPHQITFQIRYKPKLEFYDLLMTAAQKINGYPHWETNRMRVVLKNFEKHRSLAIGHNAFTYQQDSNDEEMEGKHIQQTLEKLPGELKVKSFNRIGYRKKYLTPAKMSFESLVNVLYIKLFSQEDKLRRALPSEIEDLMYRLDFRDDNYRYHVTVGPVRKFEIPKHIAYNIENHLSPETRDKEYQEIIKKYPDVAIFSDVDFYQESEELRLKDVEHFVSLAKRKVYDIINDMNNYLFNTKMEA